MPPYPSTHTEWVATLTAAIRNGAPFRGSSVEGAAMAEVPAAVIRTILTDPEVAEGDRGELELERVRIVGVLDLAHSSINRSVSLHDCEVAGLDLSYAKVASLKATSSRVSFLTLTGANVTGSLDLKNLIAEGLISAQNMKVSGFLSLEGARLLNPGIALKLDGAHVEGGTFLSKLVAKSAVEAQASQFDRQLDLTKATIENPLGRALNLDRSRVGGHLHLNDVDIVGQVHALGIEIDGQLNLAGSRIKANEIGTGVGSFVLNGATVHQLLLRRCDPGLDLDLTAAKIDDLVLEPELSRRPTAGLRAAGWSLKALHGAQDSAALLIEWLDALPHSAGWSRLSPQYSPQPWHELADVLDRQGNPDLARQLRFEAAKRTTKQSSGRGWIWRHIYGIVAGYGYKPSRAAGGFVFAVLLGVILAVAAPEGFVLASSSTPSDATTREVTGATECDSTQSLYPCFDPILVGGSAVLPAVATFQNGAWVAATPGLIWSFTVLKAVGWIFAALLLAAVTGLLRKT